MPILTTTDEVVLELSEMRKLHIFVPEGAEDYARNHADEIEEYRQSMKIHEISDLIISLVASRKQTAQRA